MLRLVPIAILVLLPGCHRSDGLPRVEVRGKVAYDGTPVKHGMIVFRPANNSKGPAAGTAIVDGKFLLTADKGPTAGPHDVEVKIADVPEGPPVQNDAARAIQRAGQLKSCSQQVEIKSGLNEFEFSFTAPVPAAAKSASK